MPNGITLRTPNSSGRRASTFYYNNLKANVAKRVAAYMAGVGDKPDYSRSSSWYRIPEITKDVDTFFVYPTEYLGTNEGDPDFAPLDIPETMSWGYPDTRMNVSSCLQNSSGWSVKNSAWSCPFFSTKTVSGKTFFMYAMSHLRTERSASPYQYWTGHGGREADSGME